MALLPLIAHLAALDRPQRDEVQARPCAIGGRARLRRRKWRRCNGQRCSVATNGAMLHAATHKGPEAKDNIATDAMHRSPDEMKAQPCVHATCNTQHATDIR